MKKPVHYVNNKEFFEHISKYRSAVLAAKEANAELPRITEYIGS